VVFVGALLPFLRGSDYPFTNFDDPQYVFANPHVTGGLTADNMRWALTTGHQSNWHPLTWLSLQLDTTLSSANSAADYRLTNLLLHATNAALLFWILSGMTGAVWRSAVVAGLFALHPLRVESIIWVTERKDVLSTLFWLLTVLAYLRYVRAPGVGRYLLVAAALALGLMAKPMLVTLPFALLLLDYWPLRRFGRHSGGRLFAEKLPLLAIATASALITYQVQSARHSVKDLTMFPLEARLANAVVSAALYLRQTVWPDALAPFYPYVSYRLTDWPVVLCGAGLLAATISCIRWRAAAPYLFVGWFWYLGTLVPVIGLVQVGMQARADRYTYVPEIGLAVLVVWGVDDALTRWSVGASNRGRLAVLVLVVLSALTWVQVGHWQSNVALWTHALEATGPDNAMAHQNLGIALEEAGRSAEALPHLARGAELDPDRSLPHINLAACLVHLHREAEALPALQSAARIDPNNLMVRINLGLLLARAGRDEEALPHLLAATPDDPAQAHLRLGGQLMERLLVAKARKHFERAAELAPERSTTHLQVAVARLTEGQPAAAEGPLRAAIRLEPTNDRAHTYLGLVLWSLGQNEEALTCCRRAVALKPDAPAPRLNLALVLNAAGRTADAQAEYAEATRLDRDWIGKAVQGARSAATTRTPDVGLFLPRCQALQACEATSYNAPRAVAALAAVEAADERFPEAVKLLTRARADAERANDTRLLAEIDQHLGLYRERKSLRPTAP
jgi:tetratricopeptide (TPR) repeat protein